MDEPCDVLIVGAGLSGLITARRLLASGLRVIVLEARERIGGRMVRGRTADGTTVDLGGQWGGLTHHRFAALLDELRIGRFASYTDGCGVFHWRGRRVLAPFSHDPADTLLFFEPQALGLEADELQAARSLQLAFDRLVTSINRRHPWLTPGADALDRLTVSEWSASISTAPLARLPLDWLCRVGGSGGFEPWEVSILHMAWCQAVAPQAETPEGWLVQGGAGGVAERLAADLERAAPGCIRLGAAVASILQTGPTDQTGQPGGMVHLTTTAGQVLQASLAVVAVPPPLRAAIRFEPPLPAAHCALLQRSPMGAMTKILATYRRPFWREQGCNGLGIGDRPVLELVADSSPPEGTPAVLASFLTGERAITLEALGAQAERRMILDDLVAYLGEEAGDPLDLLLHRWNAEPWTGGAFTSFPIPGTWTSHARVAAMGGEGPGPADHGRVLWAGTEASPRWPGYFEGAIEAGELAAARATARLRGG